MGIVVIGGLLAVALTGCDSQKTAQTATEKKAPLPAEAQIKTIQDNPNMPPAAKEAALRSLQQGQASGAGMRQAAQKK